LRDGAGNHLPCAVVSSRWITYAAVWNGRPHGNRDVPLDITAALVCWPEAREVEVLRLIADGMDTLEIAQRLSYSERTVRNIIHALLTRMKLRNRTHAVAYALRNGAI
jgi:DNA-binding CsgD family transcriptional regulator